MHRRMLVIGWLLGALLLWAGTLHQAPCTGHECRGLDPQNRCHYDAYTVWPGPSYPEGRWGRIAVELRYSPSCQANWSRVQVVYTWRDSQNLYDWPNMLFARAYEHGCHAGECWYREDNTLIVNTPLGQGYAIWTPMVSGQVTVTACGGMKDADAPWYVWYSPWGCYSG